MDLRYCPPNLKREQIRQCGALLNHFVVFEALVVMCNSLT